MYKSDQIYKIQPCNRYDGHDDDSHIDYLPYLSCFVPIIDTKLIEAKKLLKRFVDALAVSGQDSLATNMMIGRLAAEIYEFLDEN